MTDHAGLVGQKISRYQITAKLGRGAMGVVYRARDENLQRDVAVKVLPEELTRDGDRLRRFEREARTAGMLNHPNVLAVYDFGLWEGAPYLVTELLEGQTLRQVLGGRALPLRKAVDCAIQTARGLGAAHEKGIIHRDLKPENLFVCSDGRIKILDFGLAKFTPPEALHADATLGAPLNVASQPGAVVGTVGYLAPEQLRGENVDQRADLFSLGAVLYEMISGRRAFGKRTPADTMSAILNEDPPALAPPGDGVNATMERIMNRCLQKNPAERYQNARDLAFQLELTVGMEGGLSGANEPAPSETPGAMGRWAALASGCLLGLASALLAAAVIGWWRPESKGQLEPRVVTERRLTDFAGLSESPALSPDERSVAFVSDSTGTRQIWVRLLAGGPPLQLTRDAGDHLAPRWSRDSASLIYFTPAATGGQEGVLWEIPALGGAPRRLIDCLGGADLSHGGDRLAFFRGNAGHDELMVSARDGSDARLVLQLGSGAAIGSPRWSPDDRLIGYESAKNIWDDDIYEVDASGGKPRQVTQEDRLLSGFAWTPDGSGIVYSTSRGNTILYLPRMSLWLAPLAGGPPRQVTFGDSSDSDPDIDRDGRVVLTRLHLQFDVWKIPVDGSPAENVRRAERITRQTGQVQTPTLGPGDKEVAYLSDSGGHGNVWVATLATGESRQITFEQDPGVTIGVPVWSPDGRYIAYASTRTVRAGWSDVGYWVVRPDGGGVRNAIREGAWATWSRDGQWIYYISRVHLRVSDVDTVMRVNVDRGDRQAVRSENGLIGPDLGPGDATLYFVVSSQSADGGEDYEILAARPPKGPAKILARIAGWRVAGWQGLHPVVSHGGQWLVLPLEGSLGTDIWLLPAAGGDLRRVTDFGPRRTFIARRLAWSADDRYVYAAVGEGNSDVVELDGLLPVATTARAPDEGLSRSLRAATKPRL